MNFGNSGVMADLFVILAWGIPLTLLVWFVRTLTAMATSLRDIADRTGWRCWSEPYGQQSHREERLER